jgi:predicted phosphodiesterase
MVSNSRILAISDLHVPYHHKDTFKFLAAVKQKYKPTRVVFLGDEVDHHALSFHDSDPDLCSAGDEIEEAIGHLRQLYKIFPEADILESNHGSMVFRKAIAHGVPRTYLKTYRDVLCAPDKWRWTPSLRINFPDGRSVFFHHGLSKDVMKVVLRKGMCVVQGHFHTEFKIGYAPGANHLLWGMAVGCSIDDTSYAFAYNKTNLETPILGHGIIIDGLPKLLPMTLDSKGRWNGKVP